MDEKQLKKLFIETFNTVATGYDNYALRFFSKSAKHLTSLLNLKGDEQILDIATGTGHAALTIAACLPQGKITGVDFSPGMLDQARQKAVSLNINNVEFLEMDMQALEFPDNSFDIAICAFGIFFVEDMDTQLSHISSKVKPGGKVAVTSFHENYLKPQVDLLFKRLVSFGVELPPKSQSWKEIGTRQKCTDFFKRAGLKNIKVEKKNTGYFLEKVEEWWDVVWNAGMRRLITQLSPEDQKHFKEEHLQEVGLLKTNDGLWLDVEVLFATGTKP